MKNKDIRILSVAPSTRGFGYAVLEDQRLINWGVTTAKGDKNAESLKGVEKLIRLYQPHVLTIQDTEAKDSRRAPRIRKLARQIISLAKSQKIKVKLFSCKQMQVIFFEDGKGTKHDLAQLLAEWYPEELGNKLPPKRKAGDNEDSRMDIFDAMAFGVAFFMV